MRAALLLTVPLLVAGGCRKGETVSGNATVMDDGRIECRIGADREYNRFCTLERSRTEQGLILTVRKPDGGFRKLVATRDGRGVTAADGAEEPEVRIIGTDMIEVAIGGDTFRLPARVGPVPRQGR